MAFGLMDTFIYKGKKPNFSRDQFQTLEEMIGYPEYYLPDTFIATCVEDGNAYLFNRNNSKDNSYYLERCNNNNNIYNNFYSVNVTEKERIQWKSTPKKNSTLLQRNYLQKTKSQKKSIMP